MQQVLRCEIKYLVTVEAYYRLKDKLSKLMQPDPHNGANGYRIRSLYFDSMNDRDYWEKVEGLDPRRKIRLRIYDPKTKTVNLEMKQKQGATQLKRSLTMSRTHASEMLQGNYDCLLTYEEPFAQECYAMMETWFYRPKVIVEYQRTAFIAKENKVRLTLDREIDSTERCEDFFAENPPFRPAMERFNVVLEVKFNGFLPSYIKDMIEQADASPLSVGKYTIGRF